MRDIGGLGGTCTLAIDLNNRGQVVGLSEIPGDVNLHPFVWEAGNGMTDLLAGSPGATAYWQVTINQNGVVASGEQDASQRWQFLLWRKTGGKWKKTDIGLDLIPTSINESEQVIGYDGQNAFFWEKGGAFVNLNTLIPPNAGMQLIESGQINDLGEISASGVDANNNYHAVLLIPCDESHPGIQRCDYSMVNAVSATAQSAARPHFSSGMQHPPRSRWSNRYHMRGLSATQQN